MSRTSTATALALLLIASLTACGSTAVATQGSSSPSSAHTTRTAATPERGGTAAHLLAELPVKGRAPMTGYARELFGASWSDTDDNGCDTRDDVLSRDLTSVAHEPGSRCEVASGTLLDPYTASPIHFRRGDGDLVDVDHVVALGNAWVTGAFRWTAGRRLQLANDPAELLAVDASANRQKGDGDAATWLPPSKGYRCAYVARQVSVKAAYGLWVTPPEREAMMRVLSRCPDQPAPADHAAKVAPPQPVAADGGFANCDAARAAGAAPVHRGDPGYSARLDRDGDGTGCE